MMFKFLRRILCLLVITAGILAYVIVTKGGKPFRWFGSRAGTTLEQAGEQLKRYSHTAAEEADRLHESAREARHAVDKLREVQESVLAPDEPNEASPGASPRERRP